MGYFPFIIMMIVIAFVMAILYWRLVFDTRIIEDSSYSPFDLGQHSRDFDITKYWRVWLVVLICFVITVVIVYFQFLNTYWRDQLWLAAQIGIFPGWLIGGAWHLLANKPTPKIKLRNFFVVVGLFSIFTVVGISHSIPLLRSQREQIGIVHSLSADNISRVDILIDDAKTIGITESIRIEFFKKLLAHAKLTVWDMDKSASLVLQIEIHSDGNVLIYNALTPTSNPDDIVLKPLEKGADVAICIPGLKLWLDEHILNKKS